MWTWGYPDQHHGAALCTEQRAKKDAEMNGSFILLFTGGTETEGNTAVGGFSLAE
jgi:hypothetical protein